MAEDVIWGALIAYGFAVAVKYCTIFFLEWKLSQKKEWYLGLILPFLCFWDSMARTAAVAGASVEPVMEQIAVFFRGNIETAVLVLFYLFCRLRVKRKREMQEMKVKDLS